MPISIDIAAVILALLGHSIAQIIMTKYLLKSVDSLSEQIGKVLELAIRQDARFTRFSR